MNEIDYDSIDLNTIDILNPNDQHKLAEAIRFNKLSNADILTLSIERSNKKFKNMINNHTIKDSQPISKKLFEEENNENINIDNVVEDINSNNNNDSSDDLKDTVIHAIDYQFLDLLNHGSFDQLVELNDIGERRAQKILQLRQDGRTITSLDILQDIGMTPKVIKKFKHNNITKIIGL